MRLILYRGFRGFECFEVVKDLSASGDTVCSEYPTLKFWCNCVERCAMILLQAACDINRQSEVWRHGCYFNAPRGMSCCDLTNFMVCQSLSSIYIGLVVGLGGFFWLGRIAGSTQWLLGGPSYEGGQIGELRLGRPDKPIQDANLVLRWKLN